MKINFDLNVLLYLAAMSLGLFSAILLLTAAKNKTANRLLAYLILAITGWLVDAFFRASGIYNQNANLYFLPIYYSFAFGPLLYFYVQAITNSAFRFKYIYLLHFIPVTIQALFYWIVTFKSYQYKYHIWFSLHQPYTYRIEYDGTWLSLVIYLILSIIYFNHYHSWLKDNYSNVSKKMLNWLKIALVVLVLVCITWVFEAYLRDFRNTYYQFDISTNLLCGVIYCIGIIGVQQTSITLNYEPINKEVKPASASFIADEHIARKIDDAMVKDKLYLNPELSLADLANHLSLPAKVVSANINAAFDKPFNTYVNAYRVEEIKQRLKSTDIEKFTLLGIAFESGFNSKTSFNRIFKDFTGKSPSDFIKK